MNATNTWSGLHFIGFALVAGGIRTVMTFATLATAQEQRRPIYLRVEAPPVLIPGLTPPETDTSACFVRLKTAFITCSRGAGNGPFSAVEPADCPASLLVPRSDSSIVERMAAIPTDFYGTSAVIGCVGIAVGPPGAGGMVAVPATLETLIRGKRG